MRNGFVASSLLAGVSCLSFTTQALAQVSGEADLAEEIVVTAQNRAQSAQDVPIALQVISGEDVAREGISDFTGIQRLAPAVQITNDNSLTRVTVRGVGTNDNSATQDASVVVNIDGEYINRPTVMNASLFDLERVEVLRGPQGTLYGRNGTGGAINFITRKPGADLGFNFSASYGNFDHVLMQGGIDVPLGDIGGLRFSGSYSKRDGYFRHPNLASATGDDDTRAGRISLSLRPTDGMKIDLAYERSAADRIIANSAFVNFNNGLGSNANYTPGTSCNQNGWTRLGADPRFVLCIPQNTTALSSINPKNYVTSGRGPGIDNQRSQVIRGRFSYDFGAATLTYTGGYRDTDETQDASLTPAYIFKNFANDINTHSHELRLNGGNGGFQWQGGIFYFQEDQKIERGLFNGPPFLPGFLLGANGGYINYFKQDVYTKSWSAFGQTDIPITNQLTVVAGARYTDDRRRAVSYNYGGGIIGGNPTLYNTGPVRITAAPLSTTFPTANADKITWLVGLNYKPDNDTLLYGKVSTGFKAGGFDSIGAYKPETNTAYEAGIKKSFGGGSTINFSGFYYDYKDLQAAVLLDSSIGGQVFNAGRATIWGLELDTSIKVFNSGRLTASVNYLNAKYDSFLASYAVFCASETHPTLGCKTGEGDLDSNSTSAPIVQPNLSGNRPPQAPRWIIAVGYDHEFDLGSAGTLTPSVFSRFKSSYFLDVFNFNDSKQKAYFQTDANLEWRDPTKQFGIQLFVRNLEDNQPLVSAGFTAAGNDDIYNWQFGAPRTYGVRMLLDF